MGRIQHVIVYCLNKTRETFASLVTSIVNNLLEAETTVVVAQLGFMEGLGLVKAEAVVSADLIRVLIGLRAPKSAVPVLSVAGVSGS